MSPLDEIDKEPSKAQSAGTFVGNPFFRPIVAMLKNE
jgi:hypothetical protein